MNNKFDFDIYTDSIKVIQNEINTVSDVNKLKEMLVFVVEQLENDEHKLKELGHRIDRSSTLNGWEETDEKGRLHHRYDCSLDDDCKESWELDEICEKLRAVKDMIEYRIYELNYGSKD